MTYAELRRRVRAQIAQEQRYAHVVRVARLAETLARIHGESTQAARLAGMLHDLARLYSGPKLVEECERRGLAIDAFERAHPVVLHARISAELAAEQFGVTDEAVLSAIRKHTLADAGMSRLDAIVYLADALEPGRDYPQRASLLQQALRDLHAGMRAVLASTTEHLHARNASVAPQTLAALEAYTCAESKGKAFPKALVDLVQATLLEKKAEDVVTLPLEGRTTLADYFVLASGHSKVHTRAIIDAVAEATRKSGSPAGRREGYGDGAWILLDLGSVIVHVFTAEQRAFYNLEQLWGPPPARASAR